MVQYKRAHFDAKEALDAGGTGAAEAMDETFAQLEDLLASRGH